MPRVYLDSCVIIYYVEGSVEIRKAARARIDPLSSSGAPLFVSELTRLECRVHPIRSGNTARLADYDRFFALPQIERLPLDSGVFEMATELRARHGFKTPDALHAAAAIKGGCDELWTNDGRLSRLGSRIHVHVLA
jgi:uncharacterized protein